MQKNCQTTKSHPQERTKDYRKEIILFQEELKVIQINYCMFPFYFLTYLYHKDRKIPVF